MSSAIERIPLLMDYLEIAFACSKLLAFEENIPWPPSLPPLRTGCHSKERGIVKSWIKHSLSKGGESRPNFHPFAIYSTLFSLKFLICRLLQQRQQLIGHDGEQRGQDRSPPQLSVVMGAQAVE